MAAVVSRSSEIYEGSVRSLISEMNVGAVGSLSSEMWMSLGVTARKCI